MELIPSSAPHWHILLNHFPSVGVVIGFGLLLASFYLRSEDLRRASLFLFVILALLTIPTYITGAATRWQIQSTPGISGDMIAAHQDAATLTFMFVLALGWLSWFTLWQYRRFGRAYGWMMPAVVIFSVVSLLQLTRTGSLGGDINHPEIRTGETVAASTEMGRTESMAEWVLDNAWVWPGMEAAHFIGMALLFGVMLLIIMRVLGIAKSVPFSAFHRLLPLGVFGFMLNVVTGMMFFVADSGRYTAMTNSFYPKMTLIVLGGVAMVYFTIFDRTWDLKPGDDARTPAKLAAVVTVLMWGTVVVYGRLLPYLDGG